jgi:5S rRNA maturation endonuclease (ribonuclease M5)
MLRNRKRIACENGMVEMHFGQHVSLQQIVAQLRVVRGPDSRGEYVAWCPFHGDGRGEPPHEPNFWISERGAYCYACKWGGSLRKLAKDLGIGLSEKEPSDMSGKIIACFKYFDENGTLLYEVLRRYPKKFQQRRPDGQGGWIYKLGNIRRVLYRLPELLSSQEGIVHIVEGEKDVDRLRELGLVATTNSEGAEKWRPEHAEFLRGREVVILPDNDEPGRRHAALVVKSLTGIAKSVKVVNLPELLTKGDVSDWLAAGHTVEELGELVTVAECVCPVGTQPGIDFDPEPATPSKAELAQADRIVKLATDSGAELFRDIRGEPYCRFSVNGHEEVWSTGSRQSRAWLTQLYGDSTRKFPNLSAMKTAVNALDAMAVLRGRVLEVQNRVAGTPTEIFVDLSDPDWQAVSVTAEGWNVVQRVDIPFRRYKHQAPHIPPVIGGTLDDLSQFINVSNPQHLLLLKVYIVSTLIPWIPHPVLNLYGPKGSSKSTFAKLLRLLLDPSVTLTQTLPTKPDDLIQQLDHNWMSNYDNLSGFPDWVSDVFCRAVTGEGMSKRSLFTNDDDFIYSYRRCVVLNGINISASRSDLLDRSILIGFQPISGKKRMSEEDLWKLFGERRAGLFGAILTTLSKALAIKSQLHLSDLPRMADFAHYGAAVAMAMGYTADEFLSAYETNVSHQNEEAINAHPVGSILVQFIGRYLRWQGSPSELLGALTEEAGRYHIDVHQPLWPKQPNQLTRVLKELVGNLESVGVFITPGRGGVQGRRLDIRLQKADPPVSVSDDDADHRHRASTLDNDNEGTAL